MSNSIFMYKYYAHCRAMAWIYELYRRLGENGDMIMATFLQSMGSITGGCLQSAALTVVTGHPYL
jgi:hypothetical protein